MFRDMVRVIKEKDPAIRSTAEVILYPSFWAVINHRIAHKIYKKNIYISRCRSWGAWNCYRKYISINNINYIKIY